jgi:hypothetical protein
MLAWSRFRPHRAVRMHINLDTVTDEVLTRISFVTPQSSLYSVALVLRILNRLATSYLYATVNFKDGHADTGVKYLIPFAFLAFQKPYIASLVRSFSIRDTFGTGGRYGYLGRVEELINGDNFDPDDKYARRGWPDHPDRDQIIRSAVEWLGYTGEEVDEWLATLLAGDDESAILAILLPNLKKLCHLDLCNDWLGPVDVEDRLVSTMLNVSQREKPFDKGDYFSALTDVLIAGHGDKYPTSPVMLGACLALPALRRLYALNMGENGQDEATASLAKLLKGNFPVEEIELRESRLYSEDLKHMLSVPKALKTFIYEMGQPWVWIHLTRRTYTKLSPVMKKV